MTVGIIAEDRRDVAVVSEITLTLLRPYKVSFSRFVGDGCGKLRRKCRAWANILVQQGCRSIVVVHDLDENNEEELRALLSDAVAAAKPSISVVLLPKREIEAWLLYDGAAIAGAYKESRLPRLPGDPESLGDPKKHLNDLIKKTYRKTYLSTVHNALIAKRINPTSLTRAASFARHPVFAAAVRVELATFRLKIPYPRSLFS